MQIMVLLLFGTMILGQSGSLSVYSGLRVNLYEIALLLLWAGTIFKIIKEKTIQLPRLWLPMATFAAVAAFSILVNLSRHTSQETLSSFLYLLRWVLYTGVYAIVLQRIVSPSLWLWGLYGSGAGLAVVGLVQYVLYPDLRNLYYLGWDPHYFRLYSTLLDPNFAGIIFVLTFVLGMYLWQSTGRKALLLALQTLLFVVLLLTYSRSSFLAFLATILSFAIITRRRAVLALSLLFLLAVFILPLRGLGILSLSRRESSQARFDNWRQSIIRVKEAPFFGHGFGPVRLVPKESPPEVQAIPSRAGAGIDSSLLFVWATTGTIGLFAYGWLITGLFKLAMRASAGAKGRVLGQVYLTSLVALGVHSLFINSLFYPWVMAWLWILTAAVEASTKSRHGEILSKRLKGREH